MKYILVEVVEAGKIFDVIWVDFSDVSHKETLQVTDERYTQLIDLAGALLASGEYHLVMNEVFMEVRPKTEQER